MRVKAIDLRKSVFQNETEAMLYVIKDVHEAEDTFVFSIPLYTFSVVVKNEKELDEFMKWDNLFRNIERREKLIEMMKREIREFDE